MCMTMRVFVGVFILNADSTFQEGPRHKMAILAPGSLKKAIFGLATLGQYIYIYFCLKGQPPGSATETLHTEKS